MTKTKARTKAKAKTKAWATTPATLANLQARVRKLAHELAIQQDIHQIRRLDRKSVV